MQQQKNDLAEYLASLADGEYIEPNVQEELSGRLDSSSEFRAALLLQTATKGVLHNRREQLRQEAPSMLTSSVLAAIAHEASAMQKTEQQRFAPPQPARQPGRIRTFINSLLDTVQRPLIAFPVGLAVGVAAFLLWPDPRAVFTPNTPQHSLTEAYRIAHNGDDNICRQAYDNFGMITAGKIGLQVQTEDENELKDFFASHGVSYPVYIPKIRARLAGGVVTEYKGHRLAHFVYKAGDKLIYAYEVPEDLLAKHTLSINSRALEIVDKATWYWEEQADTKNTLVLWRLKSNMCSIVTNLRTEQLSALIQVEES